MAYYSNEEFPEAMFICVNPFHTYRSTPTEKGRLIIIAGEHQMVGEKNTRKCYKHLEKYVRNHFDIKSIEYHWVNQDNGTPDGRPIIGETSQKGVYVATGFGGWGMTHGTTAAKLITDLINDIRNPLAEIFDPLRFKNDDFDEIVGADSLKSKLELVKKFNEDNVPWPKNIELPELVRGEFAVIEDKFSLYKDDNGQMHRLQAICSHMGCLLVWNDAEKTWDCPCHGARFNHRGKAIHGPAVLDLKEY